tara:strand:+ start:315 stop:527 length:213 start_codon:yes stop_codon:yes gene_type:complete
MARLAHAYLFPYRTDVTSNVASSVDLTLIIGFVFLGGFWAMFVFLLFLLSIAMTDGEMCIFDILVSSALF